VEVKEVRRERAKDKMTIVIVLIEGPIYRLGKSRSPARNRPPKARSGTF
jgi:hypothetical protein